MKKHTLVLSRRVSLLEGSLDGLLGVFTLRWLLEGVGRDDSLEGLELESVSCRHEVVVVDDLDERLDLVSLGHSLARHRSSHFQWVSLDTGNDGVWEGVCLGTIVGRCDNHNLLSSESSVCDDGNLSGLDELGHLEVYEQQG